MPIRHTIFCLFLLVCACLDPFHTQFDELEDAVMYEAKSRTAPPAAADTLLVMTWNIRYGGARVRFFYECNGYRYSMTESEVNSNLEAVAGKIREVDPDVLLMQEVDVCSKRSHYLDQMQYLLDHTALNYGAYASIWKGDCIPSDGLGRIDMGNAIFSKWPLREALRIALPARTDQDALQGYFFFHRNILKARVAIPGGKTLWALTVHTEPPAAETVCNLIVANGRFFGGGMKIAPDAQLNDGMFDVICMGDFSVVDFVRHHSRLYDGSHLDLPKVWQKRAKSVRLEADQEIFLDIDGESPGKLPAEISILPQKLNVLCGESAFFQGIHGDVS